MTPKEIRAIAQQLHIKLPMATQEDAENFLIAALAAINAKAEPVAEVHGDPDYVHTWQVYPIKRGSYKPGDKLFLHPAIEPAPQENLERASEGHRLAAMNSADAPAGAAPLPDAQLCRFYDVDNFPDLVAAMDHHIEKLQAKLPPTPSLKPTRVREG